MSALSTNLLEAKFFPALATTERVGEIPRLVRAGKPYTFGLTNGLLAIYDERGWPWLKPQKTASQFRVLQRSCRFRQHQLKGGAYVPHASDGGFFLREILPAHRRPQ